MIIYELLLWFLLILISIWAIISDLKWGIVPNKIIYIGLIGIIINLLYYMGFAKNYLYIYLSNFGISFLISILLYAWHFWAAGDSKLLICICLLIPGRFYGRFNLGHLPIIYLYVLICLISYLAIVFDSIKQFFLGDLPISNNNVISKQIKRYFIALLCSRILSYIEQTFFEKYFNEYASIIILINMLLILVLVERISNSNIMIGIMLSLNIAIFIFGYGDLVGWLIANGLSAIFIVILSFVRNFVSRYNYMMIPTQEVSTGMVLSYMTVALFSSSNIKNLPQKTTEDLKSRLTEEQADAIHRWGKSKYGKETVLIVRKVPFAIYIVLGFFIFCILGFVI